MWTRNAISIRMLSAETTVGLPIFTKTLHDIVALVALFNHAYTALSHSVSEYQSDEWRWTILTLPKCSKINWLPQQRPLGYHNHLHQFCNPHTCDYLCWKADEDRSSSCRRIDDDHQIKAEMQRNFHLLECNSPLHDIVALVAPFNHRYTRRYPIPFLNARAISARGVGSFATKLAAIWQRPLRYRKKKVGLIICNSIPTIWCKDCENRSNGSWDTSAPSEQTSPLRHKIGCHGNVHWGIRKTGPDQENSRKIANTFHLVKILWKSVQ